MGSLIVSTVLRPDAGARAAVAVLVAVVAADTALLIIQTVYCMKLLTIKPKSYTSMRVAEIGRLTPGEELVE